MYCRIYFSVYLGDSVHRSNWPPGAPGVRLPHRPGENVAGSYGPVLPSLEETKRGETS